MQQRLTFTCSHCGGAGLVNETKLSPFHRKIIATLRYKWLHGVAEMELVAEVYRGHELPFYALLNVKNAIRALNQRMRGRKIVLKTNKVGPPNRRYHMLRTEGERHGNSDRRYIRNVPRRDLGDADPLGAAPRETE